MFRTDVVTLVAGNGALGLVDGVGIAAAFNSPCSVVVNASNSNIFVIDTTANVIRLVTPSGSVTTLAGSLTGALGNTNGVGTAARFSGPWGAAWSDFLGVLLVSEVHMHDFFLIIKSRAFAFCLCKKY